jgi:hypothetical protein
MSRKGAIPLLAAAIAVLAAEFARSSDPTKPAISAPIFVDVTRESGLSAFRNVQGDAAAKPHILEVMGGGVAFLDYNRDGNLDILLVRGSTIEGFLRGGSPVCALYKGDGKGRFADATAAAGMAAHGWGQGVAVADYDNDGWDDIFIAAYGPDFLYRNHGDGTFEEVAQKSGVNDLRWGLGAAFGDIDRDGDLDLYVTNYLEYPLDRMPERDTSCNYRGFQVFCGPRGLPGSRDALYLNDGKGKFHDVAVERGIDPDKLYGLGVVIADYDNDGWPDIFIANDLTANLLYHNLGHGKFEEVSVLANAAFSDDAVEQGSMGVDFGDFNNDGWLDLYYSNSSYETNTLLDNNRDGSFTHVTNAAGHGSPSYLYVGWGTAFADLDNDGWEDLLVVNGHLYPEADRFEMGLRYKQRPLLFMNQGGKTFGEAGERAGLTAVMKSRGLAFGDYDNDGDLDSIVNNLDDAPVLWRNDEKTGNHWLLVRCIGSASNRSAVGARVVLRAGKLRQTREIKAGTSYLSSNDLRVHFGLGTRYSIDSVEVRWPSGKSDKIENLKADRVLVIEEGKKESDNARTEKSGWVRLILLALFLRLAISA